MPEIIQTFEHSSVGDLTEDELVELMKCPIKLIDSFNLKECSFTTSYYIGVERISKSNKVLIVKPKLDKSTTPTHYFKMLDVCLRQPEILNVQNLFSVSFDKGSVQVGQDADFITPLLIIQFLIAVKRIVKSGLKKSYYKVEQNLKNQIKGKIKVGKTLGENHLKNKLLHSYCSFDQFGINTPENRLIKKALQFVSRYGRMSGNKAIDISSVLAYILPAFEEVNGDIDLRQINKIRFNPFYRDYPEAIALAKLILQRFGFNINSISNLDYSEVPPFWIDMSKLFELYVWAKLNESINSKELIFQAKGEYGYVDFLKITKTKPLIIDAKYKLTYKSEEYIIEDIRQLSAYARDKGILRHLSIPDNLRTNTVLKCLIIYPDIDADNRIDADKLLDSPIKGFEQFFKLGIGIPLK